MGTLVALAKLWIPRRIIVGFRFPWVLQIQGNSYKWLPKEEIYLQYSTIFYNVYDLNCRLCFHGIPIALPTVQFSQRWPTTSPTTGFGLSFPRASVEHVLQFPDVWCIEKQGSCQCLLFKWDPKILQLQDVDVNDGCPIFRQTHMFNHPQDLKSGPALPAIEEVIVS